MEKLFYEKTYIKTFEANVTECRPGENGTFEVFLNRTAFYPEGGGQPSDIGTLGEAVVLSVKETKEGIIHQTDRPLLKGNVVKGVLDWKRRFSHMQNHTGEHLLSGVVHLRRKARCRLRRRNEFPIRAPALRARLAALPRPVRGAGAERRQ